MLFILLLFSWLRLLFVSEVLPLLVYIPRYHFFGHGYHCKYLIVVVDVMYGNIKIELSCVHFHHVQDNYVTLVSCAAGVCGWAPPCPCSTRQEVYLLGIGVQNLTQSSSNIKNEPL